MHSSILEALRTEADMRRALERQEFVVYYQPVVDLSTLTIQGLEALVRWDHPDVDSSVPTSSSRSQRQRGSSEPSALGS